MLPLLSSLILPGPDIPCTAPALENNLRLFPALTMFCLRPLNLLSPGMCSLDCLLWFLSSHSLGLSLILEPICVSCGLGALFPPTHSSAIVFTAGSQTQTPKEGRWEKRSQEG